MKTIDGKKINPLLKMTLEMGPLAAFFFANAKGKSLVGLWPELGVLGDEPIFLATAVFMVAISISLVVSYWLTRTLPIMPVVTGVVVLVFGGLTLYLQDELFIKLKPTIINTLFGTILLGGLYFGKTFLGVVFGEVFKLDAEGWRKLTFRWGIFFLCLAVLNEIIWRNFSTDFWVSFKVWGMMPISMAFTLSQMPLIMRHSTEPLGEE
ncbi:MAG: septation protein A [Rhizobiaceae bacterium]|nr:septation protein A [Rhizobiaceae bacterium]